MSRTTRLPPLGALPPHDHLRQSPHAPKTSKSSKVVRSHGDSKTLGYMEVGDVARAGSRRRREEERDELNDDRGSVGSNDQNRAGDELPRLPIRWKQIQRKSSSKPPLMAQTQQNNSTQKPRKVMDDGHDETWSNSRGSVLTEGDNNNHNNNTRIEQRDTDAKATLPSTQRSSVDLTKSLAKSYSMADVLSQPTDHDTPLVRKSSLSPRHMHLHAKRSQGGKQRVVNLEPLQVGAVHTPPLRPLPKTMSTMSVGSVTSSLASSPRSIDSNGYGGLHDMSLNSTVWQDDEPRGESNDSSVSQGSFVNDYSRGEGSLSRPFSKTRGNSAELLANHGPSYCSARTPSPSLTTSSVDYNVTLSLIDSTPLLAASYLEPLNHLSLHEGVVTAGEEINNGLDRDPSNGKSKSDALPMHYSTSTTSSSPCDTPQSTPTPRKQYKATNLQLKPVPADTSLPQSITKYTRARTYSPLDASDEPSTVPSSKAKPRRRRGSWHDMTVNKQIIADAEMNACSLPVHTYIPSDGQARSLLTDFYQTQDGDQADFASPHDNMTPNRSSVAKALARGREHMLTQSKEHVKLHGGDERVGHTLRATPHATHTRTHSDGSLGEEQHRRQEAHECGLEHVYINGRGKVSTRRKDANVASGQPLHKQKNRTSKSKIKTRRRNSTSRLSSLTATSTADNSFHESNRRFQEEEPHGVSTSKETTGHFAL